MLISFACTVTLKSDVTTKDCGWKKSDHKVEAYYVNMDKSVSRKHSMNAHLAEINLKYDRVSGLSPRSLHFPSKINMIGS